MSDDALTLELEPREVTGKAVKHLRTAGTVPAVIHDHGKESLNVQGPYLALYRTYLRAGKHHPVHLVAGPKQFTALIKSVTFEPRKNQLTHIVFNAVDKNQKVEAEIPIKPRYAEGEVSTPAEKASLIVLEQLNVVMVRAVPDKLPDLLEYDAEKLVAEDDEVTVADLELPNGVELADPDMLEHPVARVVTSAALEAANAAAGGTAEIAAPAEAPAEEAAGEAGEAEAAKTEPEETHS